MNKTNQLKISRRGIRLGIRTRTIGANTINAFGLLSCVALAALGFVSLTPSLASWREVHATALCKGDNGYVECDATSTLNTYARIAPVVSVGMQSDVVMDIVPKSSGVTIEQPVTVTVATNSSEGYSLYMKTLDDTNAMTSTSHDNTNVIKPVDGGEHGVDINTLASQGNVWGYSIGKSGASTSSSAASSSAPSSVDANTTSANSTTTNLYKPVPLSQDQPIRKTSSVAETSTTDTLDLTFGLHVDTTLPSGTYTNEVLVSAVANPVTITSLDELVFMQDMTSSICENTAYDTNGSTDPSTADTLSPVTKQLIDTRDGKKYWVSKLKDGNCWMVQDLKFDLVQGSTLSPSDTNIDKPWTVPVGTQHDVATDFSDTRGSFDPGEYVMTSPEKYSVCSSSANVDNWQTNTLRSLADERCSDYVTNVEGWSGNFEATSTTTVDTVAKAYDSHYLIGVYYGYRAITAEHNNISAEYDICPKNWRLPQVNSSDNSTGYPTSEYYQLFHTYDADGWTLADKHGIIHNVNFGDTTVLQKPFYFVNSGHMFGNGTIGYLGYAYYSMSNLVTKNATMMSGFNIYPVMHTIPFVTGGTPRHARCLAR